MRNSMVWRMALAGAMFGAIAFGGYRYYTAHRAQSAITEYRESDRQALTRMLHDDWYWLVAENATDFSTDYMFDHQAATFHYPDNSLTITVYREDDGTPAGFVTYHMLNGLRGRVQFLSIGREYRRKGYGKKLLSHAVAELQKRGACFIELAVRQSNVRAQALYRQLGFVETWRTSDGFAGYAKSVCPRAVASTLPEPLADF